MAKDFYITLPSNSSLKEYPDNNGSFYTTLLAKEVDLEANDYEIALSEITFSNTYFNVHKNTVGYTLSPKEGASTIHFINEGLYDTANSLIKSLNEISPGPRHGRKPPVKFYLDRNSRKVSLKVYEAGTAIKITEALGTLLSIEADKVYVGPTRVFGAGQVDVHRKLFAIYVYCSIVEYSMVGDTLSPLLRVIPSINKQTEVFHKSFARPHYMPLALSQFKSIEVFLADDKGEALKFESGKTIATIHIRKRKK